MSNTFSSCNDLWHVSFCTKLHLKLVQITDSKMVQFGWDGDAGFWVWSSLRRSYWVLAYQFVTILDLFHLCVSFGIMSLRFGLNIVWILVELTSRGKSILWNCLSGWESMKATFINKLLPSFVWLNGFIFKIKEMIKYFDVSLAQSHSRLVIDNLKFTNYISTDKVVQPPNSIWSNLQKKCIIHNL